MRKRYTLFSSEPEKEDRFVLSTNLTGLLVADDDSLGLADDHDAIHDHPMAGESA
ncbi:hypothetical protein Pla52n_44710 [Stieleria varia]|uniref:Uncharacterized protein n=1 Tax=Stieleria varia TaxID=2528005 RepID=A0A5C6AP98_9BACT|nr:hypothetical protein Pla52n_44710 [Stieleria varia]